MKNKPTTIRVGKEHFIVNGVKLNGNQKRFLANPSTKELRVIKSLNPKGDYIGDDNRLIYAYTNSTNRIIQQLQALGLLTRYNHAGYYVLTDKGREVQQALIDSADPQRDI